ncbi:MAG TPA: DUF4003 family protein [Nannocystis exedens]|nr:DUF4003 family protein [Nannocystis exedens]
MLRIVPFRSDDLETAHHLLPADPLVRFTALHRALEQGLRWWQDGVPLRLAAITMVTSRGEPEELATAIRSVDKEMEAQLPWYSSISASVRLILAAQIVKYDDSADAFLAEVSRMTKLFREVNMRRNEVHEALAVLVLRRVLQGQPAGLKEVQRMRAIYEEMKRYHWFLTGPEDIPACAMLVGRPGTPEQIGAGIEAIYQALNRDVGLWQGDPLQTASNVLYLSGLEAAEVAERFTLLMTAFRDAGARIGQREYDELAILCFLAQPIERIVESVLGFRDRLQAALKWTSKASAFNLAASLAFVRLVGTDVELGALADAKLLLDMQAIVAARQAAAAGAAAS